MKIGFIGDVHRRGGMERVAAEILERVAEKHEVVVIAKTCELEAKKLRWVPVRALKSPDLLCVWSFRRGARRAASRQNCALTVSVNANAVDADVISAHFCNAEFRQRFGGIRGGRGRMRRGYQALAQRVFAEQERRAFTSPRLKKVIAVSEGLKREIIKHYHLPAHQIVVVPNGVDHRVFKPCESEGEKRELRRKLGLPPDAFVSLFVGGDWERKGLADAIKAVAGLPADAVLAVVGRGDVKHFSQLAAGAKIEDRVLFFGPSMRPQDYYAAADVFVFPSRYEAFSLATLEAAASGLPVIAPRINGTEELIEDGVNGFFVEMNPASILEKLLTLKEDPEKLRAMSQAVHRTSLRYTWDQVAAESLRVFEAVYHSQEQGSG